MNNFTSRTITGIGIVLAITGAILLGKFIFFTFFLAIALLCYFEFTGIVFQPRSFFRDSYGSLGVILSFSISYFVSFGYVNSDVYIALILWVLFLFIIELYSHSNSPFLSIAYHIAGVVYIGLPFSLLNILSVDLHFKEIYSPYIVLALFIIIWINDTGAYLTGMKFGKHRLFERISPKKSWEGFAGGIIFSVTASWVISIYFPVLNFVQWIGFAIIAVIFGTFGDLIESMLKRSFKIKDSGSILPGHGGLLDRFDSILFAAPAVFIYLYIIRNLI